MSEYPRARTEQKLRFAKLHLDELSSAAMPSGRGHDFERAHQEAVLAQLIGAYDSFRKELKLKAQGRASQVLRRLDKLREDKASWLRHALDLRNTSTHVSGIPLSFYVGGEDDGKVALKHPLTMVEFPDRATDTLAAWLQNMKALFDELREVASGEQPKPRP